MFLPAQQIDFLSGTRQKMTLLSSEAVPLVFSYLRSRSSFVFVFSEIPMFFAGKTLRFFAGYPAKNADFVVGSRSSRVFLFEKPLLFVFVFSEIPMFLPAKQIDFLPGTRQKMPILASGAAPFVFSYLRSRSSFVFLFGEIPTFFAGYPAKKSIFCRVPGKKCRFCRREPLLLCFPI